ncbi:uncharacterized protein LOC112576366 [Pomacea canaliculata]|uniref:uncharacterized protein LOC112576366 n=1 Tax=Pomacea canaliculata TaxID=400727 RepID=UPI000D736BFE|nr:uncharacterized protein LOC112576366 [Pomacea canaliculata]
METVFGVDIPLLLLLLPLVILLLYWKGTRSYNFWSSRGIPGPKPQPFFGNQWQMNQKGNQKSLREWSKAYGRVYGIYFNHQPMLVTNDLDILREVMVKDFPHFTDRYDQFNDKVFSKTVFFARGHDWRRIRNIITPSFTSGKLRLMENFINRCSEVLCENMQEVARCGGKINVKQYCGAFTMDVITGTAFGILINSQKDFQNEFVTNAKLVLEGGGAPQKIFRQLLTLSPFLNRWGRYLENTFAKFAKKENRSHFFLMAIKGIVADRKKETAPRKQADFLQLLVNAEASNDTVDTTAENGKSLTSDEIVSQMMIFFLAGYETTATTLQYMFYNLALYPDVQQKIVDEIQEQIGDAAPTNDNVSKLKYMEQTIKETLRLFPPVASVNRLASETVTIKGVTIPKGVGVLIPIYDVMRDPEYFPDPEVFRPERFSEEAKDEMNPASFLAFGFGPRLCIGKRLALLEVKIALVHVLRKVKFVKTQTYRGPWCVIGYIQTALTSTRRTDHHSIMEAMFGIDIPLLLLLLPLVILLLYWKEMRSYNFWSSRGIPGPKPQPLFGNQWQMQKTGVQKSLKEWSKVYGRVYGIYFNHQPMLVTNDLDILREVMVKDFPHFTDRYNQFKDGLMSKSIFFARGDDWKRIRNIMTPTFTSGKLRLMENFINRCSETLSENMQDIARCGGKINVKEYCGAFTMDVITGTAFGILINSQKDLQNKFVKNAKTVFERVGAPKGLFRQLLTLTPFLKRLDDFLQNPFFKNEDSQQFFFMAIRRIVAERKEETVPRKQTDFLQLLVNAEASEDFVDTAADNGKCLTHNEIIAQMMIFFLAGYETTATTLQYTIYNLALYPDVQQKIVDEIKEQIGDEAPTNDNVSKLKYMEQTIKETLRLFSPVAAVNRLASETVTIKGVTIPKGVGVVIPIYDVLRDTEYFPDPEVFRPERFSDEARDEMNPLSFLAFGFGPRLCIGKRLALLEVKIALVHVLRRIKFVKTQDLPQKLTYKASGSQLVPTNPLMIKAVLRGTETAP